MLAMTLGVKWNGARSGFGALLFGFLVSCATAPVTEESRPFIPFGKEELLDGPPPQAETRQSETGLLVNLATASWRRNGYPSEIPQAVDRDGEVMVVLPLTAQGERWTTEFVVEEAFMARARLRWLPDQGGCLMEILLDGERLGPPRDGWRPSSRVLRSDLGPRWIAPGRHLLEFVCRERLTDRQVTLNSLYLDRVGPE